MINLPILLVGILVNEIPFDLRNTTFNGRQDIFLSESNTLMRSSKASPFGDIDIPAPYSLILDDLSKIMQSIKFCLRTHPSIRHDMPAPTIPILLFI